MITSQDDGTWFTWLEPVTTSPKTLCTGIIWSFRWIIIWLFACPAPPLSPGNHMIISSMNQNLTNIKNNHFMLDHPSIWFAEILKMIHHTTSSKTNIWHLKLTFWHALTCFDFFWLFLTFKEGALQEETTTHLIWTTHRAYWIINLKYPNKKLFFDLKIN